jgi:predicted metalloendopeptidase
MTFFSTSLKQIIEEFFGTCVFYMNPIGGVFNVNDAVALFNRDYFPTYVVGGNNQPYLTHLATILERDRTLNRHALTRYSLKSSGHIFLRDYLRDTNFALYERVYVNAHDQTLKAKPSY